MSPVIPLYPLSREELFEELRGKENSLLDDEQDFLRIAEAVWPDDGPTEAPPNFREDRMFERDEIIAGIVSLHELISRLLVENDVLRERH
jgi:hypothetical protein